MKKGDICEVVGDIGRDSRFYSVGDKCKLIEYSDFTGQWICDFSLNEKYNGDGKFRVYEVNLRPISEFKRGDRVICGWSEDYLYQKGEYYGYDNEASGYKHMVRGGDGNIRSWPYCKKAEPEIKKDTKVLVRQHKSHQWDRKYTTGKFIDGYIQCYSNGADSWSGGNSFCTCWKYWKLADEND